MVKQPKRLRLTQSIFLKNQNQAVLFELNFNLKIEKLVLDLYLVGLQGWYSISTYGVKIFEGKIIQSV